MTVYIPDKLRQFIGYKFSLFAFFYFLVSFGSGIETKELLLQGLSLFMAFLIIGFFGYFTNDMADMDADKKAWKKNMATSFSALARILIVLFTGISGLLIILAGSLSVWPWMVLELILLLIYSFPPFRLKEKGILGVLVDALYAYAIPAQILLSFIDSYGTISQVYFIFFPAFYFFIGLKNILQHQIDDADNDQVAGISTFAVSYPKVAAALLRFSLVFALVCWVAGTVLLSTSEGEGFYLVLGIIPFIISVFKIVLSRLYGESKFEIGVPEGEIIYYGFIVFWIYAIYRADWIYLSSLIFILSPSFLYKIDKITHRFWAVCKIAFWLGYRFLSFMVNNTLYYSFLVFGIDLKKRAANKNNIKPELRDIMEDIAPARAIIIPVQEKNVHALWIGTKLSSMELLSIQSFLRHGYIFNLWLYEPIETPLPANCRVKDASEIIPADKIFRYKYASQFGIGKGSVSGFSDIFRYKLLHDVGGWWVDMDVSCIKPFDVADPYFFRAHHNLPLVGNVMKAPKGSELMWQCYVDASAQIDENNRDWHKPISILIDNVNAFGLEKYIVQGISNTDEWNKLKYFVSGYQPFPENWYFVHWCNEVWRSNGYSKDNVIYRSSYGTLLHEYGLLPSLPASHWEKHDRNLKRKDFFENLVSWL